MNPSTALARVLVDELVRCGVRDAVLSPGSRSAPLALALHAHEGIRLHVRIDERSAGFLALGLAKASSRPVPLLCSSGTATANFHPAVLEAAHAHVPIIVLTADRPPELRRTGANQTVDQIGLYGPAVRFFAEVGVADASPGLVAYWRSLAARVATITDGPTHLNVAFREPLVPDGDETWIEPLTGRPGGAPWIQAEQATHTPVPIDHVERGAVVVGDGANSEDVAAALRLAEEAGWPVLSEPTGNARRGPNAIATYPLLLGKSEFTDIHRPELVVTIGKPTLSRTLLGFLHSAQRLIVVDQHDDWADPTRNADLLLPKVPTLHSTVPSGRYWLQSWKAADTAATAAISNVLDGEPGLSEPRLARDMYAALPEGAMLFAGTSRPIRDLDIFGQPRDGVHVIGNRGASGIDGLISTVMGAALVHNGPTYALIGDLAYLHDRNGLVIGPEEPRPDLTIVVVDNDGGGIFSLLPQAGIDGFERIFGTPHGVDIAHDCAAVGVPFVDVREASELEAALAPAAGVRVVRLRTRREATAALHRRLSEAVREALAS